MATNSTFADLAHRQFCGPLNQRKYVLCMEVINAFAQIWVVMSNLGWGVEKEIHCKDCHTNEFGQYLGLV